LSNNSDIKILLVDDREDNLASMEIVLEKEGYMFSKATSGKGALKILLTEDDFSLILLDVKMPIMDGYETAEIIYQREKLRHIPIIFITAHDYEEAAVFKGYKAGAVDYIRKPFNPEILRSKVAVFAELHKKNLLLMQQEKKLLEINRDLMDLNQQLENRVKERTLELEKLNYELKQLNLSKDKFLSVISHDLRNPFSVLLGYSDMLRSNIDSFDKNKLKQYSKIIYRSSSNILQQLNELVEWAKQQREKLNFNPHKLKLNDEIKQSLEVLKDNAYQKNIKLNSRINQSIFVKADPFMLRSIIQNLVTNSIKNTEEGGLVTVSAACIGKFGLVEISVKDTGSGIPQDKKEKLLEEIHPASSNGINEETGKGLGLILVKDFIAHHGGTIDITSKKGKGTTFKFTLPGFDEKVSSPANL
jgi:two-component system sensor histidine kinase/response regulator